MSHEPRAVLGTISTTAIDSKFLEELRAATAADNLCQEIFMDIRSGQATPFAESGDLLFFVEGEKPPRLYIPSMNLRSQVLKECHDTPIVGHLGRDKTIEAVSRLYYWPTLHTDVVEYVRTCIRCQQTKASAHPPAGLLQTLPTPTERLRAWAWTSSRAFRRPREDSTPSPRSWIH